MGLFRNTAKETVSSMSGCAIFAVLALPFAIWTTHNQQKKAEEEYAQFEAKADAESCRIEQHRTEDEAIAECQNAAAIWGQDISDDPARLANCIQRRENTLRTCGPQPITERAATTAQPLTKMQMDAFMSVVRRCPAANRQACVEAELKNMPREDYEAVMAVLSPKR